MLLNVPSGLVGLLPAARGLTEYRVAGTTRLDLPGFALAATGLAATVYALGEVGERGVTAPPSCSPASSDSPCRSPSSWSIDGSPRR